MYQERRMGKDEGTTNRSTNVVDLGFSMGSTTKSGLHGSETRSAFTCFNNTFVPLFCMSLHKFHRIKALSHLLYVVNIVEQLRNFTPIYDQPISMSAHRQLLGECSCRRNRYSITIPHEATSEAQVLFSNNREDRRAGATLLSAWLRVPLTWYMSSTIAEYPDETHSLIKRTYTPYDEPNAKRHFCGFCGTQLSHWTEEPASEAEYLNVTLASLLRRDIEALEELDLLPDQHTMQQPSTAKLDVIATSESQAGTPARTYRQGTDGEVSWFEEMISGSRLGNLTRRGMGVSADGTTAVQWEISEFDGREATPEPSTTTPSKRKIGDVGNGEDIAMKG